MANGPPEKKSIPGQNVVEITKARRLNRINLEDRPKTEPPCPVNAIWAMAVPEDERAELAAIDLRIDMRQGDPFLWVLRKANYILENAALAFKEEGARETAVIRIVEIIRDYGEPEGAVLLKRAIELFGTSQNIRDAVGVAAERMGLGAGF